MLEAKEKGVLDKPEILRRETTLTKPEKKRRGWLFKIILIVVIAVLLYYLFTHLEIIRNPVDKFLGRFT